MEGEGAVGVVAGFWGGGGLSMEGKGEGDRGDIFWYSSKGEGILEIVFWLPSWKGMR